MSRLKALQQLYHIDSLIYMIVSAKLYMIFLKSCSSFPTHNKPACAFNMMDNEAYHTDVHINMRVRGLIEYNTSILHRNFS